MRSTRSKPTPKCFPAAKLEVTANGDFAEATLKKCSMAHVWRVRQPQYHECCRDAARWLQSVPTRSKTTPRGSKPPPKWFWVVSKQVRDGFQNHAMEASYRTWELCPLLYWKLISNWQHCHHLVTPIIQPYPMRKASANLCNLQFAVLSWNQTLQNPVTFPRPSAEEGLKVKEPSSKSHRETVRLWTRSMQYITSNSSSIYGSNTSRSTCVCP